MTWDIFFDEISVSLDCCITGPGQPINKNYAFKRYILKCLPVHHHLASYVFFLGIFVPVLVFCELCFFYLDHCASASILRVMFFLGIIVPVLV